ncbi:MAG TPA: hypothetical protein ENL08_03810 [Bacteroidetes bacterium]|nr:hypothetical protein [Bacteroidota bacterium]
MEKVSEMSLVSMWTRSINGPHEPSFGIITSWKRHLSLEDNIPILDLFIEMLKSWQLGFYRLYAYWQTCQSLDDPPDRYQILEKRQDIYRELLLFIPRISVQQLETAGRRFEQSGWIYTGPQSGGQVKLYLFGGYEETLGILSPETIAEAYTKIRNYKYEFKGFRMPPQGFNDGIQYMSAEKEYKQSLKVIEKLEDTGTFDQFRE